MANRLEVERESEKAAAAAAVAAEAAERAERAAAETVVAERAKVLEWYEQHKDHWPEDLPLPPGIARNCADNSNGSK